MTTSFVSSVADKVELTKKFKSRVIQLCFETKSMVTVRRILAKELNVHTKNIPRQSTLRYIVKKFVEKGELNHLGKGQAGRKKSVRVQNRIEDVYQSVVEHPRLSCRRRAQTLHLKRTSVHSILRKDL